MLSFVGRYGPPEEGSWEGGNESRRRLAWLPEPRRSAGAQAAAGSWCQREGWLVEQAPAGKRLQPEDLHAAMVATRRARLG